MKKTFGIMLAILGAFSFVAFATGEVNTGTTTTTPTICTMEYAPVCGTKNVECTVAPCYPMYQTYGNNCMLQADRAAFAHSGECMTGGNTGTTTTTTTTTATGTSMTGGNTGTTTGATMSGGNSGEVQIQIIDVACDEFGAVYEDATGSDTVYVCKEVVADQFLRYGMSISNCDLIGASSGCDDIVTDLKPYYFALNFGITTMPTIQEFRLSSNITRQEAAKMFVEMVKSVYGETSLTGHTGCENNYKDANLFGATLSSYVQDACNFDLMKGDNGMFNPNGNITKGQALAVIMRAVDARQVESTTPWWKVYANRATELGLLEFENFNGFDQAITRGELIKWMQMVYENMN